MPEFFIVTTSFAAPFVSETDTSYIEADSAQQALELVAERYPDPPGLYAALAYSNADAYHKGEKHLSTWLSNHEQAKRRLTGGASGYSYYGQGPGLFEINGTQHHVENPKAGSVIEE